MQIRFAIASGAALALAACGAEDTAEAPAAEDTVALVEPDAAAEPDASTPEGFVALVASSDLYEIEAGRLAEQMATSQEVKDFGAMMVRDHTASSDKLEAAVAEVGSGVTVPATMLPRHQRQLDALRNAAGNFDRLYTQQQVAAHQEAFDLLQRQAETGAAEPLKAFAAETAPIVEGHLEQVRELAGGATGAADAGAPE